MVSRWVPSGALFAYFDMSLWINPALPFVDCAAGVATRYRYSPFSRPFDAVHASAGRVRVRDLPRTPLRCI
jgi:hypothetical protein